MPIGDRPPSVRTKASLTMQTRGLSRVSRLSKARPATCRFGKPRQDPEMGFDAAGRQW